MTFISYTYIFAQDEAKYKIIFKKSRTSFVLSTFHDHNIF